MSINTRVRNYLLVAKRSAFLGKKFNGYGIFIENVI